MSDALQTCPQCGNSVETLKSVDTGMKLALRSTGHSDDVPEQVCAACHDALGAQVSAGFKLRVERDARNKNKVMMWKNRVNLVRQARVLMVNKSYSEAAVAYEKYLRVLEVVYNLGRGELTPNVFNNSARSKEMSIIASAYWDLMRIYDTNSGYGERMSLAAQKLALFLPFSPLYPDIVRKAEHFARSAKNPHIVRQLLRQCKAGRGACFIATAVFENEPYARELLILRRYRDEVLKTSPLGRQFVLFYYKHSPAIATKLRQNPRMKKLVRPLLQKMSAYLLRHLP